MGTAPVFLASTTITPLPTTTTTEEEEQENHKKNTSRNLKFKHGKTSKQNKASKQDKSSKQNTISRTLSFSWLQLGVDIDDEASWDESGESVSLSADGKTVAIGAVWNDGNGDVSGHTRVFRWNQSKNMWEQMGNDMDGEAIFDGSGTSVSLSSDGRTVAIGAVGNDGNGITTSSRGHTRVFRWIQSKNMWEQMGNDMDGETSGDLSGNSVSLSSDGETVAIGAYGNGGNGSGGGSGHTRVFKWNPFTKTWEQMGNDIDGESSFDYSGESVLLSANGMTVAIGARYNDGNGNQSGHTRVFRWNQSKNTWQQMGKDVDGEATSGDASGWSVSLSSDGEIVAIGALGNDGNGIGSGHTCVFRWNPSTNTWEQMGKDIMDGEAIDDKSGSSVSLSANGETVAIGAVGNDGNGSGSGHVRVYSVTGGP